MWTCIHAWELSLAMHKHAVLPPIPCKWALCFDILNRIDVMVHSEDELSNDLSEWSVQHSNQCPCPTLQVDGKKTQATLQKKKIQRMEAWILQYGRLLEPHPWRGPPHQCENLKYWPVHVWNGPHNFHWILFMCNTNSWVSIHPS